MDVTSKLGGALRGSEWCSNFGYDTSLMEQLMILCRQGFGWLLGCQLGPEVFSK